jgi:hypothetical protein
MSGNRSIFDFLIDMVEQKPSQPMDDLAVLLLDYNNKLKWFIDHHCYGDPKFHHSVVHVYHQNLDDPHWEWYQKKLPKLTEWQVKDRVDAFTDMVYYSVVINKLMKGDPLYHDGSIIANWEHFGTSNESDPFLVAAIHSFIYDPKRYNAVNISKNLIKNEPHVVLITRLWCLHHEYLSSYTYDQIRKRHDASYSDHHSRVDNWTHFILDKLAKALANEFQSLLDRLTTEEQLNRQIVFMFCDPTFIEFKFDAARSSKNNCLSRLLLELLKTHLSSSTNADGTMYAGPDRNLVFRGGYSCSLPRSNENIDNVWPHPGLKQYTLYSNLRKLEILTKYRHYELTGDIVSRVDDFTDCNNSSAVGHRYQLEKNGIPYHYFEGHLDEMMIDNDLDDMESINSLDNAGEIDDYMATHMGHDNTDDECGFGSDDDGDDSSVEDDLDDRTEDQKRCDSDRTFSFVDDENQEKTIRLPLKRPLSDVVVETIDLLSDNDDDDDNVGVSVSVVTKKQKLTE